jgi:hypothetical protein
VRSIKSGCQCTENFDPGQLAVQVNNNACKIEFIKRRWLAHPLALKVIKASLGSLEKVLGKLLLLLVKDFDIKV